MKVSLETPIAAYLRASSHIQEDSHERQHALISKFLTDNSLSISPENWFSDFRPRDAAAFAPDFQALLSKARRGLVKTVLVSNLDRWGTTDVDEFFEFRGVLLKAGCKLWSVEDGDLCSKKMGDIITIIVKAEQMREYVRRSAKNIASGKERLAQAGHWTGGKSSPFGYDRLCIDQTGRALWLLHYETPDKKIEFAVLPDGTPDFSRPPRIWAGKRQRPPKNSTDRIKLVPSRTHYGDYRCQDKDRVEMVRLLFSWLVNKPWSIRRISRELMNLGYRMYGKPIHPQAIVNIVTNEKYKGDLSYNKRKRAKLAQSVKNVVTEIDNPPRARSGRVKSVRRPPEQWDITPGTHDELVDAEAWRLANEALVKLQTRTTRQPRSNAYYLRPLLICGHCGKKMEARMENAGRGRNRKRYPVYYCSEWDDVKQYKTIRHCVKHVLVEKFILSRLQTLDIELNQATEAQAILELYEKYNRDEGTAGQALRTGVEGYLAEVRRFQEWAGCPDSHLTTVIGTVARHPDWNFTDKGLNPAYDELKAHLRQIDARKVSLAKKRLAELQGEHRAAVRYVIRPDLDERTLEVAQHEVNRLASQIKELEPETVPFLERYKTMLGHLEEFGTRLSALRKTFQKADVDARAVRLAEVLKCVRLHFLPKKKWQETTLDEARCELEFNHPFDENAGTC
jgi:DNA invertase Pin-like site-specific DNA recombinase